MIQKGNKIGFKTKYNSKNKRHIINKMKINTYQIKCPGFKRKYQDISIIHKFLRENKTKLAPKTFIKNRKGI